MQKKIVALGIGIRYTVADAGIEMLYFRLLSRRVEKLLKKWNRRKKHKHKRHLLSKTNGRADKEKKILYSHGNRITRIEEKNPS